MSRSENFSRILPINHNGTSFEMKAVAGEGLDWSSYSITFNLHQYQPVMHEATIGIHAPTCNQVELQDGSSLPLEKGSPVNDVADIWTRTKPGHNYRGMAAECGRLSDLEG